MSFFSPVIGDHYTVSIFFFFFSVNGLEAGQRVSSLTEVCSLLFVKSGTEDGFTQGRAIWADSEIPPPLYRLKKIKSN